MSFGFNNEETEVELFEEDIIVPKVVQQHKILVVDDEKYNIDAAFIILKYRIGIDISKVCLGAIGGKKALKMIKDDVEANGGSECSYSLILMDYNMPFMDGCETTRAIRQYLYERNID